MEDSKPGVKKHDPVQPGKVKVKSSGDGLNGTTKSQKALDTPREQMKTTIDSKEQSKKENGNVVTKTSQQQQLTGDQVKPKKRNNVSQKESWKGGKGQTRFKNPAESTSQRPQRTKKVPARYQ